jgi:AraC-like DNA-binding protein
VLSDLETYRAAPLGRTCASEHLLVWFPSATLRVVCAWGAPTEADIALLIEAMRAELQDLVPPHHSLVDVRDVRAVDGPAYERLFEFIRSEAAAWDRVTLSSRLVHSGGLVAGLLAGYKAVAGLAVRTSTHASLVDALDGLGPSASELEAGLRARRDAAALETRVLRAFRAWLEAHLVDADAETCAQTIGLSLRSLQRHLAEAGTTFRAELARARVNRAKALLVGTDLKILAVASEVGYPRVQSLAEAFRQATGLGPAQWRERARRA